MRNYFKVSYKSMLEGKAEEFFFFDDEDKSGTRKSLKAAQALRDVWQEDLSTNVELRVSVARNHAKIRGVLEIGQFVNLPPEEDEAEERPNHLRAVGA